MEDAEEQATVTDKGAEAYRLKQLKDNEGKDVYTWSEIAKRLGYNSYRAALMAAQRFERRIRDTNRHDPWQAQLPWRVSTDQKNGYIYRMLVLHLKDQAGQRLNEEDAGRLELFRSELAKTYADAPLGEVVVYDEDMERWGKRPRLASDTDLFVAQ